MIDWHKWIHEQEAKRKLCPVMTQDRNKPIYCFASTCMFWEKEYYVVGGDRIENDTGCGYCRYGK